MIFNDFLNTTLASGNNPKEQLKIDLSTFKSVFNYANKSDDIYNNLIDNIVKLLSIKFGTYQIIYSNIEVMYNELLITLNPQIPQFMMIQKKQLIESLNTFGDLNNWGDVLKDNVSRNLQLTNQSSNTTNFVPIDGSDKDPYSISDVSKTNNSNETTDINRLATDYLNFYMRLNWNVGDIELNSIYESYIHLFKIYYEMDGTSSTSSGGSGSDDVWNAINLNTRAIEMVSDEVDTLSVRVDENIIDTNANTSSISNLNNDINTINTTLDNVAKLNQDNTFRNPNNFLSRVCIGQENSNRAEISNFDYGNKNYTAFKLIKGSNNNMLQIEVNNNDNVVSINSPASNNNLAISNLKNPTNANDATNKSYVDNALSSKANTNDVYNKSQVDSMTNTLSSNISTVRNMLNQTNSDLANNYLPKTFLNTMFPVGSLVMTTDGTNHALVRAYPNSFEELNESDIAYLAIGNNSSNSNSTSFTIYQNNLPNLKWAWSVNWNNGITASETGINAFPDPDSSPRVNNTYSTTNGYKNSSGASTNGGCRAQVNTTIYLNGNVAQTPISLNIKPKTLKVRVWKVIRNLI